MTDLWGVKILARNNNKTGSLTEVVITHQKIHLLQNNEVRRDNFLILLSNYHVH